ncbi:MAG: P-II family nitrogen regulator [Flexilinea sp.]
MAQKHTETIPLVLMVVIVNRGKGEKISNLFTEYGSPCTYLILGRGTADKKILSYLGLGETEKDILYCAMPYSLSQIVLEKLNSELKINRPGKGIAFSIPLNGIADISCINQLQNSAHNQGGIPMEDQPGQYDLIIAITNQGYADEVMEAAKSAGAPGGTIVHARGVGIKQAEKFFGISIQPEKEMLFILTPKEIRQDIMTMITEKKGLRTEAKTIVFSLPVNGVAGLAPEE